ncbi:hypothetical protein [Streptomyces similanensis]|uniref:Integral membrane protein n=1 Tax=Streptomyces similanensis TaxID=1274988 RepID=A0ABP9LCU7_9ACTN|nr:hypothetical protein HUT11_27270 [Streptomyces seoulensis]
MTLLPVFAGLVLCLVGLRGLLGRPTPHVAVKAVVLLAVPVGALAWLSVVTAADYVLFPDTAPCPREPYRVGVIGGGAVTGVSRTFPPRAYCAWEDGTTYELATGSELVFWVCFGVVAVALGAGLWRALRDPLALVRR